MHHLGIWIENTQWGQMIFSEISHDIYVLSKLYQSISKSFEIIDEKSTNLIQILQNWEKNLDDWNTTWTMFWFHGVIYSLQNDLTWSHLLHHTYLYTIRKSLQNNLDFTHKIAYLCGDHTVWAKTLFCNFCKKGAPKTKNAFCFDFLKKVYMYDRFCAKWYVSSLTNVTNY